MKIKIKKKLKRFIYGRNHFSSKNFNYISERIKKNAKVLIIGGGTIGSGSENFYKKCKSKSSKIESIDVYYSENITAIADAHYLPFDNNLFDVVIIQAVLEHVINPKRVVDEIYRVLIKNGLVYAETPFMQCVHEGPFDFNRFSHSGHRWLFKKFKEVNSGAHHGAFSSSIFIFSYALSGLFRCNTIGMIIRVLLSRISSFLDTLNNNGSNIDVACGTYFIGIKSSSYSEKNLKSKIGKYYKGSQKK